jgi:hypothetical protein
MTESQFFTPAGPKLGSFRLPQQISPRLAEREPLVGGRPGRSGQIYYYIVVSGPLVPARSSRPPTPWVRIGPKRNENLVPFVSALRFEQRSKTTLRTNRQTALTNRTNPFVIPSEKTNPRIASALAQLLAMQYA